MIVLDTGNVQNLLQLVYHQPIKIGAGLTANAGS